jgi:hypothetical protein
MRINTDNNAEIRFWLTRAIVIQVMSGLARTECQLIEAATAKYSFSEESNPQQSQIVDEYTVGTPSYPLGEQPLLVVKFAIIREGGNGIASFELITNQTITINLDGQMVSNLYLLLKKIIKDVDWNLQNHQSILPGVKHMWVAERNTIH